MNTYIEFTDLNVGATMRDIEHLCDEAKKNHYASVCVAPYYVSLASNLLKNTPVEIATVVSYPFGFTTTNVKSYEAIDAIQNGATEIGMVINLSAFKNNAIDDVKDELEEIRDSIDGKTMKLMVDLSNLSDEELISIVHICNDTFIHYIELVGEYTRDMDHAISLINEHKNEVLEIKVNTSNLDDTMFEHLVDQNVNRIGLRREEK